MCEFHAQGYEMHQTNAMMIVFTQHRSCAYPWSANGHGALPYMRTGRCKGTCMELHADRDHAMCNIQNHSIPVVQLTQLRKPANKNF
jgi:hypothetical protein